MDGTVEERTAMAREDGYAAGYRAGLEAAAERCGSLAAANSMESMTVQVGAGRCANEIRDLMAKLERDSKPPR